MKDKEVIFKEAIKTQLENQLLNSDYVKEEEWKGYVKYKCPNNYLKLVFNWNQDYSFSCDLGFDINEKWDYEYSFHEIIQKLEKTNKVEEPIFGQEFPERIDEWIKEILTQFNKHQIQTITKENSIINELRTEYTKRDEIYNIELQTYQTKRDADQAWKIKDYESFIRIMKNKMVELPSSYEKKLSIAEKKLKKENGA